MRFFFRVMIVSLILVSVIFPDTGESGRVDPEVFLKKADEAVKIDPDRAMDLSRSVLQFLKGAGDEYLEMKARLIIGKAYFHNNLFLESLESLNIIRARISISPPGQAGTDMSSLFEESLFWLGEIYLKLNRYNKALEAYSGSLEYGGDIPTITNSRSLIAISRIFLILSEYEKALDYAIKGGKSAEETGDIESLFYSSYLHGYIYRLLKEYDKGLIKFNRALGIAEQNRRTDLRISALNEISNIYIYQKKFDQSLGIKKEALKLAEQTGNTSALSFCLNDIALIFFEKKEYEKAIPYLLRSRQIANEKSDLRSMVICDFNMADTYLKMGQQEKSMKIARDALATAEASQLKSEVLALTEFLSHAHFGTRNYSEAYRYLKRAFDLNREIFSSEKSRKIAELETETEMEKSANRILLLEKVNKIRQLELEEQNRVITLQKAMTLMLLIIAILIFGAYRWKRKSNLKFKSKSEELEKTLAEIHKLSGLLPICSSCKKIRDDDGYWHKVEEYIKSHSEASFSHSLCPSCVRKVYPNRKAPKPAKTSPKKGE